MLACTPLLALGLAPRRPLAPPADRAVVVARALRAGALALGLALRLGLGIGRGGPGALWSRVRGPQARGASEYLPALPAFDFGMRFFLDTFAQVGTSLTVNAVATRRACS